MPFFTEEQLSFRQLADDFANQYFSLENILRDEENGKIRDEILQEAHQIGFTKLFLPEAPGEGTPDNISRMMMTERLCKSPSGAIVLIGPGLPLAAIMRAGSPGLQREITLALNHSSPARFAFALTEPGIGSDATQIRTKAVSEGNYFVLNGTKAFITGAGYVKEAGERGYAVVMAQVSEVGDKNGLRAFIVRGDNPGYTVSEPYQKMGLHASDTREVLLENCRVPLEAMLGSHAQSWEEIQEFAQVMKATLDTTRPYIAALALGIASRAYDLALLAATEMKKIRGKPLIQFQAIRHSLAEMRTEIEAVAQLTYSTGKTLDKIFAKQQRGFPFEEGSMAKYLAADVAVRATRKALEMLGGDGYMVETGAALYANAAAVFPIWEGTENIQLQTIARRLAPLEEALTGFEDISSEYAFTLTGASKVYNDIIRNVQDLGLFQENQAVRFDVARVRSRLEAGIQLGKYALSSPEHQALADYYSRRVVQEVLKLRSNLKLEGRIPEPPCLPAQIRSLSSYALLDEIAGDENNFKLRPSRQWYTL